MFQKLLFNFTWWVNRKDVEGMNIFEGGFLGLDNIGVFDRSSRCRRAAIIEQADGTAWMAIYSLTCSPSPWSWPRGPGLRRHRLQILRAFRCYITYAMNHSAATMAGACGTRRTDFSTTCLKFPDGGHFPVKFAPWSG